MPMNTHQRMLYALLFMATFFMATSFTNANAAPVVEYPYFQAFYTSVQPSSGYRSTYQQVCQDYMQNYVNSGGRSDPQMTSCTLSYLAAPNDYDNILVSFTYHNDGFNRTDTITNHSAGRIRYFCYGEYPNGQQRTKSYTDCTTAPPPPCEDGRVLDQGNYESDTVPIACISGCQALKVSDGAPYLSCGFADGFGSCNYVYPAKYIDTGAQCNPENPPTEAPPPQPDCPRCDCYAAGNSWGEVNGVGMCVPRGTPGSDPVKTPLSPPKIETTTPAPTPENPNPQPVETVTPPPVYTVNPPPVGSPPNSPPTVTETNQGSDGSSSTVTTGLHAFCEQNPNNIICKDYDKTNGYSGGGGTGEEMQQFCTENPNLQICQQQGDIPTAEDLGTSEVNLQYAPIDMGAGSGACPAPTSVGVGMAVITVDVDWLCQYATAIKPLLIASAYFTGALIVFGRIKED